MVHTGRVSHGFDKGILIAGPSHNWFHWVVEILPTIHRIVNSQEDWSSWPLILRGEPLKNENFRALLNVVAPNNQVLEAPTQTFFFVQKLIVPRPTSIPGAVDFGLFYTPSRTPISWIDSDSFRNYRSLLLRNIPKNPALSAPRRVFLTRSKNGNRQYNQDELLEVARDFGFIGVNPEEHPLLTVWSILANAQIVIGPQGAAWANTVICPGGSVGLQWNGERLRGLHFQHLARQIGMDLHTFIAEGKYDGDYRVDPIFFRKKLQRLVAKI